MIVLYGSSLFFPAKREVLYADLKQLCPNITSVDAVYLHLISCTSDAAEAKLSQADSLPRRVLDRLLAYGDNFTLPSTSTALASGDGVVYVIPRPGSVSPWSSKATDIAALCDLGGYVQRLERGSAFVFTPALSQADLDVVAPFIHDRMTQIVTPALPPQETIFRFASPSPLRTVQLAHDPNPRARLERANKELGLALAPDEITYLLDAFVAGPNPIARDPTDAELFMFAQVNSEHCRHKIFNASWTIDEEEKDQSLFQMIRNTEKVSPLGTVSAYSDNAAVFEGHAAPRVGLAAQRVYTVTEEEELPILIKVETHNHPTAVSPYPGAATGSGGEIRDEGAVGRGSKPKAGLTGFTVSDLLIPGNRQAWEADIGKPTHIASALEIMLDAPLGASAFNNEFGRPALAGYFRTFCARDGAATDGAVRGYHKPIMLAGGVGNVRAPFARKARITPGAWLIVLGGPGLLIGLGGGAASSQSLGAGPAALDFASVQRDNAEMQRRCQQVIDACTDLGTANPIQSIHDVGAGGLSNALPELVHDSGLGATFEIRDVPVADASLSPMEIWCNESQERYVLAVAPEDEHVFTAIAGRERCPFGIVGVATAEEELIVTDRLLEADIIRLRMATLFGMPPRMACRDSTLRIDRPPFDTSLGRVLPALVAPRHRIAEAVARVLRLPTVASKSFLITIGDRSVTGLVARDQMVGPWQVPVADVAVTRAGYGFDVRVGEAMAMGERTPLALLSPAASARMAVGEALTNLAAARVGELRRVKLSANWMCAANRPGEGAALYEAVRAVGMDLCPRLGVGIPVGKDSMSMAMRWTDDDGTQKEVAAPLSLIVSAFARVDDVGMTWTPQLRTDVRDTVLVLIDLAGGKARLGGSALAQVFNEIGSEAPDVEDEAVLKAFFTATQTVREAMPDAVLAYHDRSDGGLFTTIAEMAFAGRTGVEVDISCLVGNAVEILFNEELGAVVQVRGEDLPKFIDHFAKEGVPTDSIHSIGKLVSDEAVVFRLAGETVFSSTRPGLQEIWSRTSHQMQRLRDDPTCATEEFSLIGDADHTGLFFDLTFAPSLPRFFPHRPKVAVLREQGVNGHVEMAWAFTAAGFDAIDVHMSDLVAGTIDLSAFRGLAACGGFSYGDVLGAGKGWAHSALLHSGVRRAFEDFFARADTFALGVCNGCQFLSHLRAIVPGATAWPAFKPNRSGRYEARACVVEVVDGPATRASVFLRDMVGSRLPVAVAHGEGRAAFTSEAQAAECANLCALRYVDSAGRATERYPLNPNGSPGGLTGVQSPDGRVLALMPHPERVVTLEANSWYPPELRQRWGGIGPWFKLFANARVWCG
ncbi:phosphoribosylformylglycinamidine synthase [Vararia minispora EC-137]|uniref:Phosphoribosylformylglycinamidine synthase n=1 Tax=Vararia minispora EC-137 TaxID=1314806 RepID=A0ACB8QFE6_9AGAM|nr:phosphoribosylformylglycinamidine synthase [Vararia minispora EC-137]